MGRVAWVLAGRLREQGIGEEESRKEQAALDKGSVTHPGRLLQGSEPPEPPIDQESQKQVLPSVCSHATI